MRNKFKKNRNPIHLVLDIIIGVMCVLTIGSVVFAVTLFEEAWDFSYDTEAFYYRLEDEAFYSMVEMYYINEMCGAEPDEELEQYYGVVKYFEAASYYKAYHDVGDDAQMKKYYDKMQSAEVQMGELDFVSKKICEKLEIKEE